MSIASNPTTQFVLDQFDAAYEQRAVAVDKLASSLMEEWPTERPTERYTYLESVPHMGIWRRPEGREARAFRAVSWTTDTYDYQVKVEWHINDDQDHQGRRTIKSKAMSAGQDTAATKIRLATQVIESATDNTLLPAIPTAPDGAAVYASTAGGVARFGVTGGNIQPGSGLTSQAILDDFFASLERYLAFDNTEGLPLWDPEILNSGLTVMFPKELWQNMHEAFKWSRPIHSDDASLSAPTVAVAVTNRLQDFGVKVTPFVNPHLTDASDWYMFLDGSPVKPLYRGTQQALQNDIWDRANSDRARDHKIEAVGWDARWSVGVGPCYGTIKINN